MKKEPVIDLTEINEEEDQAPTPRPVFSAPSRMPPSRRDGFANIPEIIPGIRLLDSDNGFSRKSMTEALGGSIQPLIVRQVSLHQTRLLLTDLLHLESESKVPSHYRAT